MKKPLPLLTVFIALLFVACDRDWDNPFHDKNTLDPEAWAPDNLQIETVSITERKLTWSYNGHPNIEGFKIDRKKVDEPWRAAFATLPKETRTWNDTTLTPLNGLTYQYRLYAFAGNNVSAVKNAMTNASIPAPADLTISRSTITSVTLSWQDNSIGEEGFRIERKYEQGNWAELALTNNTSWQDTIFELNKMIYYRVNAYYNQYTSAWVENSFDATIPSPENLAITANTATSANLTWSYNLTGHEGFRIERKLDNGSWVELVGNLNPGQTNFTDNNVDLNSHKYQYRINAFFGQFVSEQIHFPAIPFLCGILNIIDIRDGNTYQTVQIGNQCWMKENLKWLPSVSPSANGSNTSSYYYVYGYQGTSVSAAKATANYQIYGVLYNWTSAINACPAGWHLPTDNEWTVLIDYLGGSSVAGGKMKTTGTTHWNSPNTGATNSSGFSGLPGGFRYLNGSFYYIGGYGDWWSSTEYSSTSAWYRNLVYTNADAGRGYYSKERGRSVRCVRD